MTAPSHSVENRPEQYGLPEHTVRRLVAAAVGLAAALCLVGFVIVDLLTPSALTGWEDSINQGAVDARTATMDSLSSLGSRLADTFTRVGLLIVMMLVLRWWLERWRRDAEAGPSRPSLESAPGTSEGSNP